MIGKIKRHFTKGDIQTTIGPKMLFIAYQRMQIKMTVNELD